MYTTIATAPRTRAIRISFPIAFIFFMSSFCPQIYTIMLKAKLTPTNAKKVLPPKIMSYAKAITINRMPAIHFLTELLSIIR